MSDMGGGASSTRKAQSCPYSKLSADAPGDHVGPDINDKLSKVALWPRTSMHDHLVNPHGYKQAVLSRLKQAHVVYFGTLSSTQREGNLLRVLLDEGQHGVNNIVLAVKNPNRRPIGDFIAKVSLVCGGKYGELDVVDGEDLSGAIRLLGIIHGGNSVQQIGDTTFVPLPLAGTQPKDILPVFDMRGHYRPQLLIYLTAPPVDLRVLGNKYTFGHLDVALLRTMRHSVGTWQVQRAAVTFHGAGCRLQLEMSALVSCLALWTTDNDIRRACLYVNGCKHAQPTADEMQYELRRVGLGDAPPGCFVFRFTPPLDLSVMSKVELEIDAAPCRVQLLAKAKNHVRAAHGMACIGHVFGKLSARCIQAAEDQDEEGQPRPGVNHD